MASFIQEAILIFYRKYFQISHCTSPNLSKGEEQRTAHAFRRYFVYSVVSEISKWLIAVDIKISN
jgi:hypothetical protein